MGNGSDRLWDAVSKTQQDVAHMRGVLDSKLPGLATQDDVTIAVNDHELKHHKHGSRRDAPSTIINKKKLIAKSSAALTAITVAGWGIYEVIQFFNRS